MAYPRRLSLMGPCIRSRMDLRLVGATRRTGRTPTVDVAQRRRTGARVIGFVAGCTEPEKLVERGERASTEGWGDTEVELAR
jgi:hypothetical protein